ncbi:MAG: DNA primase catalytic subunit PriS [Methanobacteriota archaeon]|nr:MAG: DNA primase catalytic subunit PriS [Euryarchaeota archaeon]
MASDASRIFVTKQFALHYRDAPLTMPDRFGKREFGFMFFDRRFMMRHMAFPSRAALKKYLVENVPAHVYYSTAYYEKPDAAKMKDKNWLAADLLFDLDADHVRGAEDLPYEQMLERVKGEVKRLLDEFLLGDLGFEQTDLNIVFSGGRGYHVHVRSPKALRLSSHERREIVDYVTGTDLDLDWVFPVTPFEQRRFRDRAGLEYKRTMPKSEDGGWRGRIRSGIEDLLVELESLSEEDAKARIADVLKESKRDIGEKTIDGLYADLFAKRRGRSGADRMREDDTYEVFSEKRHSEAFLSLVNLRVCGDVKGETDEPVTSDVRRLIRLPSSLHGKTGFEVVPLTRDELDSFDPFVDAIPRAFEETSVDVRCNSSISLGLRDQRFELEEGVNQVPAYAAVHLICRNLASIDNSHTKYLSA